MEPRTQLKIQDNRSIGRPRKRWEDDINELLKLFEAETENLTGSSNQINKTWINTAKDRGSFIRRKLHNDTRRKTRKQYENEKKFAYQTSEVRQ